ncbi:MAG: hypothetical protein AAFW46_08295 [Pseudomonadota bacterium]
MGRRRTETELEDGFAVRRETAAAAVERALGHLIGAASDGGRGDPDAPDWPAIPAAMKTRVEEAAAILAAAHGGRFADRLRAIAAETARAGPAERGLRWRNGLAELRLTGRALTARERLAPSDRGEVDGWVAAPLSRASLSADPEAARFAGVWRALARRSEQAWGGGAPLRRRVSWLWRPAAEIDAPGSLLKIVDHVPVSAAVAPVDPFARAAPPGWAPRHPAPAAFDARLVAYPGAFLLRAEVEGDATPLSGAIEAAGPPSAPQSGWREALAGARRALAETPWRPEAPVLLGGLTSAGGRLVDGSGVGPRLLIDAPEPGEGRSSLSLLAIWDGAAITPIAVWGEAELGQAFYWRAPDDPPASAARKRARPSSPSWVAPSLLDQMARSARRAVVAGPTLEGPTLEGPTLGGAPLGGAPLGGAPLGGAPLGGAPLDDGAACDCEPEIPAALAADLRTILAALADGVAGRGGGRRPVEAGGIALDAAARGITASQHRLPPADIAFYAALLGAPSQKLHDHFWAGFEPAPASAEPPSPRLRIVAERVHWLGGPAGAAETRALVQWLAATPLPAAAAALSVAPGALVAACARRPALAAAVLDGALRFGPVEAIAEVVAGGGPGASLAGRFEKALAGAPSTLRTVALRALADRSPDRLGLLWRWLSEARRLDALGAAEARALWSSAAVRAPSGRQASGEALLWRLAAATPPAAAPEIVQALTDRTAGPEAPGIDPLLVRFLRALGRIHALGA